MVKLILHFFIKLVGLENNLPHKCTLQTNKDIKWNKFWAEKCLFRYNFFLYDFTYHEWNCCSTSRRLPMTFVVVHAALRAPHKVALQCVAGHCYYHRSVFPLSFFLSLSIFCFWPTSGNLPCAKICFPQYFGILSRRYIQKKHFGCNFYFFTKK